MERIDLSRLLDDSFISDEDNIELSVKRGLYQRACLETEHYFNERGIRPTPIEAAQTMITKYNGLLRKYESRQTRNTKSSRT